MSLRGLFRWVGVLLILAGLLMLGYAGYTFAQASLAEREAEGHVPGQATDIAESAPPARPTPSLAQAKATVVPAPSQAPLVLPSSTIASATATLVPQPSQTRPAIARSAGASAGIETVVGPDGLALGTGADPDRLIIPRLKLDTRVDEATWAVVDENGTATSEWQIPFDAVAHLSTTPKPGEAGNAVISGHHNLIGPNEFGLGKFAGLWNLRTGDPVYVFDTLGRIFLYRVASHYILQELGEPLSVRQEHARQILSDNGKAITTFETCWNGAQAPLSGNTYRWIVVADLVGTVKSIQVPVFSN